MDKTQVCEQLLNKYQTLRSAVALVRQEYEIGQKENHWDWGALWQKQEVANKLKSELLQLHQSYEYEFGPTSLSEIGIKIKRKEKLTHADLRLLYIFDGKFSGKKNHERAEKLRMTLGDTYFQDLIQIFQDVPEQIDWDLDLRGLTSAKELKLPKKIGGSLHLSSLTSTEGLKLPEEIGGDLGLSGLTRLQGLQLPEKIGGSLWLNSLISVQEGLQLPEKIGGGLYL